jgi:hypothetical protein
MSYDLYCYKSQLGRPDIDEAQIVVEADEEENDNQPDPELKLKIAKALIDFNPRLESFEFDYDEIAKLQGINKEEAKEKFDHIELNTPETDLATQITIFDNNVSITIPYWYSGNKAKEVFEKVIEYTKIIREKAGYFVYDPQTETAYDPMTKNFDGLVIYTNMTKEVDSVKTEQAKETNKKSWWKFW